MTRINDVISPWHMPLGFSSPKDRKATVGDVINWRKNTDPDPIQKLSYLTCGGIIAAALGALIGIFKDSKSSNVSGVVLFLAGLGTLITGFFSGPDFGNSTNDEKKPADKPPVENPAQINNEPSTDYWTSILIDKTKSALEQSMAAKTLGKKKDKASVDALIKGLKDDNVTVRAACAWALGEIGDKKALPALREITTKDTSQSKRLISAAKAAVKKIEK